MRIIHQVFLFVILWQLLNSCASCRVLTWEDAYIDIHGNDSHFESKCSQTLGSLVDGQFPHHALGLAMSNMSSHSLAKTQPTHQSCKVAISVKPQSCQNSL